MHLTPHEVRAVLYAVSTFRRSASLSGGHIPPSVAALAARLDHEIRFGAVSPMRHEIASVTPSAGQLKPEKMTTMEFVGTRLAAEILGWSLRRVQRHAAELDGQAVGARWVFPRPVIEAYAAEMEK